MPRVAKKKVTVVDSHPRNTSKGITIVDEHERRLPGTYLGLKEFEEVFKNYDKKKIKYPNKAKGKIKDLKYVYPDADKYDEQIAVWTDYFNKKYNPNPSLDPDMIKALIASESGFRAHSPSNKIAIGITQITKPTLKTLQDPKGEVKDFIFKKIRQKDLKNPDVAIPMGIRWLIRKQQTATQKL